MSTKLRTCAGCNEALGRSEFSKNQWVKGSGTSRCKGCVGGTKPATTTADATRAVTPELKPAAAAAPPSSTDFGRTSKAPVKKSAKDTVPAAEKTPNVKPSGPPPSSTTFGAGGETKKSKSKSKTSASVSKVSDQKAALATITSAVTKEEAPTPSGSSSSLADAANQKPGEASTEKASSNKKQKQIKVKPASDQKKKGGNPVGNFFGGIFRGVRSWTRPVLNPCLKMIGQSVVVAGEAGDEDLKMQKQLDKDAQQKYSLKGRNE